MVNLPPVGVNLWQRLSFDNNNNNNNNNNIREASFSSYLNHAEKEFVHKLAESTRDHSKSKPSIKEEDGDIEVFGAEKYFNGGVLDSPKRDKFQPKKPQYKKTDQALNLQPKKPKGSNRSKTSSIRSESSLNSENALLQNARKKKNASKSRSGKNTSKSFLYNCSCCFKNSVKVDENDRTKNTNITKQPTKVSDLALEDKEKKSIEVFGSSLKPKNNVNLEEKLSELSWKEITPRNKLEAAAANIIIPPKTAISNVIFYEDCETDSSSDLFEIESLMKNDPNSFLTRQGSDCVTPTTSCYAPSEVSIEWSVVTASAADFPIMSEFDEYRRMSSTSPVRNYNASGKSNNYMNVDVRENQRRRSNLMLMRGAGEGNVRDEKGEIQHRIDSFGRQTRFDVGETIQCDRHNVSKVIDFGSSQIPYGLAKNSLLVPGRYSPAPRISNILYV